MNFRTLTVFVFAQIIAFNAFAHGGETHPANAKIDYAKAEELSFGKAADPKRTTRTITIDMHDSMRFTPDVITLKRGDTVTFLIRNKGQMLHELVIGTLDELRAHGDMMKKFPGMEHDEPYMAHVSPGKSASITWQFTRSGEFHFACLLPGHFEAGMVGRIIVK